MTSNKRFIKGTDIPRIEVDPVTLQVLGGAFKILAQEMGLVLYRMSYSSIIRESEDLGAGIVDHLGRQVCESESTPMHIGSVPSYVRGFLKRLQGKLDEGDVILHNHPYFGATHSPDIHISVPIFYKGRLVGFSSLQAHVLDIGAHTPGLCIDAIDVWAEASSIAIKVGQISLRGNSDLWEENIGTFDIAMSDFDSVYGGVEFTVELNEFIDLAIGVDGFSRTVQSNYRDFVYEDGFEIEQDLMLSVTPITVGVRFCPLGKFRTFVPYVAGGGGIYPYEYREEGEFVDFSTSEIFPDVFEDHGIGTGVYGAAGLEVAISRGFLLFGELRGHWADAEHQEDFADFGDFDLSSYQLGFGFTVRF